MALTLTEAAKFSQNLVKRGVIETIVKDSVVMQRLPFIGVVGNAYQYLQESTNPSGTFYDVNETWTEATPTYAQKTATIKILGGDADVDNFEKATRSNYTDLEADVIERRAKGIKHTFLDTFWYGDTSVNSKAFDGLHKIILGFTSSGDNQTVHQNGALSMLNMDVAYDMVRDGSPDLIVTNRNLRRRIKAFLRANGAQYGEGFGGWSQEFKQFHDIPVTIDDFLLQTEAIDGSNRWTAKTGGVTGSVFFLRFGSSDILGLQNGDLQTKKIGDLETKDGVRWRIRWYCAIAVLREICIALIDGITDAAVTA